MFHNLHRGTPKQLQPPLADFEQRCSPAELAGIKQTMKYSCVGTGEMVSRQLQQFVEATQADEIMIAAPFYDHAARLRSYEITAQHLNMK